MSSPVATELRVDRSALCWAGAHDDSIGARLVLSETGVALVNMLLHLLQMAVREIEKDKLIELQRRQSLEMMDLHSAGLGRVATALEQGVAAVNMHTKGCEILWVNDTAAKFAGKVQ